MKKVMILAAAIVGVMVAGTASARAGFAAGYVSFNSPSLSVSYGYNAYPAPVCAPRVVYVAPAPVVYAPPPVIVYRAPVVCAPRVVAVVPACCAPRWHGHYHHRCW
jgi:hypothetical protein